MFETVELGQSLDKPTYQALVPDLRERLLDAQLRLREAGDRSLVVIVAGPEAAGKGEVTNVLLEWLDARGVETHAMDRPSQEERERPRLYRFWQRLPPRGRTAVFLGSWYTFPIVDHVTEAQEPARLEEELTRLVELERMLAAEGVILVKIWLHITEAQQRKRLEKLASDPDTAWRVTPRDWELHRHYEAFREVWRRVIRRTSTGEAPWHLIEAKSRRYRDVAVGEHVLEALEQSLARPELPPAPPPRVPPLPRAHILQTLDLTAQADATYGDELEALQGRIGRAARRLAEARGSVVIVFEGMDAAGKGGTIRRLVHALDARFYRVIPIAAPTEEERAQPYLWRFWRRLPRWGHVTVFDRSWYGRVLVERIEGFARPEAWQRAYAEINRFEEQLAESGVLVLKFWLTISPEEQLRRFEEREATGYKRYKITDEDWRNREKWDAYVGAACEMFERTSTDVAPWHLVASEDKKLGRLTVLRHTADRLEAFLEERLGRPLDPR